MEYHYIERMKDVKKHQPELEKKLRVKIKIEGKKVFFKGAAIDEYDAGLVFDAIAFGFSLKKALALKDEEMIFRIIHIKTHTKRNLGAVLARLIGTRGKTKKTISEISGCEVLIKDSEVGIICDAENVENVEQAIINIIKGSKQANMYRYLERMNRAKKNLIE